MWSRHRQCLPTSADGRMVWRREIKTQQPKDRCDQPFGLAERQAEDRPQCQRRRDRQRRVTWLAAARGAGLGLPRRNRGFRKPDGQAPALAQGDVIGRPIRHSVPLLGDVMTAILIRFEWHGDCPGSGAGPPSYTFHSSPPTTDPCNKVHWVPIQGPDAPTPFEKSGLSPCADRESSRLLFPRRFPCVAVGLDWTCCAEQFHNVARLS